MFLKANFQYRNQNDLMKNQHPIPPLKDSTDTINQLTIIISQYVENVTDISYNSYVNRKNTLIIKNIKNLSEKYYWPKSPQ